MRSSTSAAHSPGAITAGPLQRSKRSVGSPAGSNGTAAAAPATAATSIAAARSAASQKPAEPAVSITRWMRSRPLPFTTLWRCHESKSQHSPAPMWRRSAPQWKVTAGCVSTGMWMRTRLNQW